MGLFQRIYRCRNDHRFASFIRKTNNSVAIGNVASAMEARGELGDWMRVIIIADYAIADGGAPQVAIASAVALAQQGHEVIYIHGVGQTGDPRLDSEPGIRRIALGGRDIWSKPILAAAREGIWNAAGQTRLAAILSEFQGSQTIVHVHQWTKFFSPSIFSTIFRFKLPLVVTLHDYFLSCPTGLKYRFDLKMPCELDPLSISCICAPCDPRSSMHKFVRVLRSFTTRLSLRGRTFTAVHVSEVGRKTIGDYLEPGAFQTVLENPIELENCGVRPEGYAEKIVFCGRLTAEKGADLVAQAARQLGMPSLFIGDGPLRTQILEIDPQAEITGWLSRSEVRARLVDEALVVVAPSRWPETGPLVVAEAMASAVPVVVSERAGAADRVRTGHDGFVVAPAVDEIVSAIQSLRAPGRAADIGAAGYRKFWSKPPSLRAHAEQLLEVYHSALAD